MNRQFEPDASAALLRLLQDPNRRTLAKRVASVVNRVTVDPRDPGFRYRDHIAEDRTRYRTKTVYGDGEEWIVTWRGDDAAHFFVIGPTTSL